MHTSDPFIQERGWPRWALWAAIPVMLSLGFVTGLGLATYQAAPAPPAQADAPPAGHQPAPDTAAPTSPAGPGPTADQSWQVPESGLLANQTSPTLLEPPPIHEPDLTAPAPGVLPPPSGVYNRPAPQSLRDARTALAREFFRYQSGSVAIRFDYQEMGHAGSRTSLVGLISVGDYRAWEAALASQPQALERWLESAVKKAAPALARDRFHLVWAVVDVVQSRPAGFADYEVTPLEDGTFQVTRPLAATVDYNSTLLSVRPLDSLRLSAAGQPTASGSPWATYGPLLRWDSSDIYRPTSAMPKR